MAISSGSQPKSAASLWRTVSTSGSRTAHIVRAGAMLLYSSERRMDSCTTRGEGLTPPLFRLMMFRSKVNAD